MLAQSTCGIPVERSTKPSNDLIQLLKRPRGQAVPSKPADLELDQSVFRVQIQGCSDGRIEDDSLELLP